MYKEGVCAFAPRTTPTPAPAPMTARLRELMAKAAAPPWFTAVRRSDGLTTIEDGRDDGLFSFHCEAFEAELIVELVNSAPTILRLLEAVEGAETALEEIANYVESTGHSHQDTPFIENARQALATLRAAREGAR